MNKSGFTLIEVLIYLALIGLIFSGLFVSAFSIIENAGRGSAEIMARGEGNFLLSKIGWAVNSADAVEVVDPATLKISGSNNYIFKENNGYLEINGLALNNSATKIKDLQFVKTGNAVGASFILQARTSGGQIYSQNFEEKYYIQK